MTAPRILQVLLLIFAIYSAATRAESAIVKLSDPTQVTHKLKINDITIGFSDKGGGYLNHLDMGDGVNIVSTGYGRGCTAFSAPIKVMR